MSGDSREIAFPTHGTLVTVPFVDVAGLKAEPTIRFMTRAQHETLWAKLEATSCLLEGPPGSGKSTAVWLWLTERVQRTGENALWCHFTKLGWLVVVVVKSGEKGTLTFNRIEARDDPFAHGYDTKEEIKVCVVDGVTRDNKEIAGKSWIVFGFDSSIYKRCHMIWVSRQQLVVPREHLLAVNMKYHAVFSWTEAEIGANAATFDDDMKQRFADDVVSGLPKNRSMPGATIDFDQTCVIKLYFCGCSARWMFGMTLKEALEEIEMHLAKVENAQLIQTGLTGMRGVTAVNHVIATYESESSDRLGQFKIESSFMMEKISETVGLEAIRAMYSSHWVQNNPSVHIFVFEWDIITQVQKLNSLTLTHVDGSESTWSVRKTVRLAEFVVHGMAENEQLLSPRNGITLSLMACIFIVTSPGISTWWPGMHLRQQRIQAVFPSCVLCWNLLVNAKRSRSVLPLSGFFLLFQLILCILLRHHQAHSASWQGRNLQLGRLEGLKCVVRLVLYKFFKKGIENGRLLVAPGIDPTINRDEFLGYCERLAPDR